MAYATATSHNTYAQIWQSERDYQGYFRIRSKGNHQTLCTSEGYKTRADCLYGLRLFYDGPVEYI
jgi:uncharacterized protein YegP (UPF0339 family)